MINYYKRGDMGVKLLNVNVWAARISASVMSGLLFSGIFSGTAIATDLEGVVDATAKNSLPPLFTGISAVSYGAAALSTMTGVKGVYNHVQNPGEKLGPSVAKLILAALLFAAPTVMNAIASGTGAAQTGDVSATRAVITF